MHSGPRPSDLFGRRSNVYSSSFGRREDLNFSYSSAVPREATPSEKCFRVSLASGATLAQVIDALNDEFKAQGTDLIAAASNPESSKFMPQNTGADMKFSVFSSLGAPAARNDSGEVILLVITWVSILKVQWERRTAAGLGAMLEAFHWGLVTSLWLAG